MTYSPSRYGGGSLGLGGANPNPNPNTNPNPNPKPNPNPAGHRGEREVAYILSRIEAFVYL